jgi:hypothetical protein
MQDTFNGASSFVGLGVDSWTVDSVKTMFRMFVSASVFNADLGKWSVAKLDNMYGTFNVAVKYEAVGLQKWSVVSVTDMRSFLGTIPTASSCTKRKIADAWASNAAFIATKYDTTWSSEPWCIGAKLTDALFKTASWGTSK